MQKAIKTHTQQDKDEKKEKDAKADKVSTGPAISLSELGLGFGSGSGSLTGSYTDLLPYALQSKQEGVFQEVLICMSTELAQVKVSSVISECLSLKT